MSKSNHKKIFFIVFIIILISGFTIIDYNHQISKINQYRMKNLLSDINNKNIRELKENIDIYIEILNIMSDSYDKNNNQIEIMKNKYFSQIDFYNKSDFDNVYLQNLIKNKFYISKPFIINNNKKFFLDIYKENKIIRGTCDIKNFNNFFDLSDNISLYITDSDGDIIFSRENKQELISDNIFDIYSQCKFKNQDNFSHIKNNLEKKIAGFAQYDYNHQSYLVNYNIFSNFYIFSVTPRNISLNQAKDIILLTSHMIFILFISIFILISYILYISKKHTREILDINQKLEIMVENIPGGVQSRLYDNDFTLKYISYGFCRLTGYEPNEIKKIFDNKFISLIYFEDIELIKKNLRKQLEDNNRFQVEYRIVKKNGEIIWVTERGQLKDNIIHNVILDITQIKNVWDNLVNNEQNYKIMAERSNNIIFEVNIKNKSINSKDNLKKLIGFDIDFKNFPENIINHNLVTHDDQKILNTWFKNIRLGKITDNNNIKDIEFKIKNSSGKLIWFCLSAKLIFNEIKQPIKAVCKIENIDAQKQKQEELQKQAQIDPLTGLYNKSATKKLIDQYVKKSDNTKKTSALLAIDIDNFKGVNDNLGHLVGDKVLVDTANKFRKIFRKSDIIGRFGGDEFVIFVKDVPSQEFIKNKAEEILNSVRAKINNNDKCKISASVGIALCPAHGLDFHELYKNADDALYFSKKHNKDSWCMFGTF